MVETSSKSALLSQRVPRRASSSLAVVERPARAGQDRASHGKRGHTGQHPAAVPQQGSGVIHIPRLVLPRDHRHDNLTKSQAQSRSRSLAQARSKRGEAATILTLIGCAGTICILGIFYVAAYARVAKQEREIHSLQLDVSVAQARHQMLVQDLAHLQSAKRIDTLATQMKMVHVGSSDYIGGGESTSVLADNAAPMASPTQMASAR
jgi:hypothetical protein